jgi:Polyketide cyclase / dehydrase and lipid transport
VADRASRLAPSPLVFTCAVPANDYVFVTHWRVKGRAEDAYEILTDVPGYLRWWPDVYLEVTPLTAAGKDGLGQSYRLLTRGKLPYRLRWDAQIVQTRRPHGFTIEATGDFVGRGIWIITERPNDLKISFDWRLQAEKPLLKYLSFLLKPLFRWNHGWAMARGEEGLRGELSPRGEDHNSS